MKNTAGPPVMNEDFFDREKEQRLVWGKLEANNLLLLAPRRVGKTSLMLRLKADAADHGYRCMFFSVEDIGDETAFVRKFYDKFCEVEGCMRQTLFQALHTQITDPDQCQDRLRYLLDILVNDGYLVEENDRYRFRFGLLRDYWFRRVRA